MAAAVTRLVRLSPGFLHFDFPRGHNQPAGSFTGEGIQRGRHRRFLLLYSRGRSDYRHHRRAFPRPASRCVGSCSPGKVRHLAHPVPQLLTITDDCILLCEGNRLPRHPIYAGRCGARRDQSASEPPTHTPRSRLRDGIVAAAIHPLPRPALKTICAATSIPPFVSRLRRLTRGTPPRVALMSGRGTGTWIRPVGPSPLADPRSGEGQSVGQQRTMRARASAAGSAPPAGEGARPAGQPA